MSTPATKQRNMKSVGEKQPVKAQSTRSSLGKGRQYASPLKQSVKTGGSYVLKAACRHCGTAAPVSYDAKTGAVNLNCQKGCGIMLDVGFGACIWASI